MEDGKLVGIATESDIVRFLARVMGPGEEGVRVTIEGLGSEPGNLEKVISIASAPQRMILSMILAPRPEQHDWMIVLRLKTADPEGAVKELKEAGFEVSHKEPGLRSPTPPSARGRRAESRGRGRALRPAPPFQ